MRFGGQYGLMLVLAIVPASAVAKEMAASAHLLVILGAIPAGRAQFAHAKACASP
jgi:hypothetical protein